MERKLLSLPSFFVLLLIAGIAFLAAPVVDVQAQTVPTVTAERVTMTPTGATTATAVTTAGPRDLFIIKFNTPVNVTSATASVKFDIADIRLAKTATSAPAVAAGLTAGNIPASDITLTPIATDAAVPLNGAPDENQWFLVRAPIPANEAGNLTIFVRGSGQTPAGAFQSADMGVWATAPDAPSGLSSVLHYNTYDGDPPMVEITAGDGATGSGTGDAQTISIIGGSGDDDIFQLEFDFSEALGTGDAGFADADVSIATTPAPAADATGPALSRVVDSWMKPGTSAADATFIVVIDPADEATKVTVGVKKDAVADGSGNKNDPASDTGNPKDIAIRPRPKVTLSHTMASTPPESGDLVISVAINVEPGASDAALQDGDFTVTNGVFKAGSLDLQLAMPPDAAGNVTFYTALVTPNYGATPVTVQVNADAVKAATASGAADPGNAASNVVTIPVTVETTGTTTPTQDPRGMNDNDPYVENLKGTVAPHTYIVFSGDNGNAAKLTSAVPVQKVYLPRLDEFFHTGGGGRIVLVGPTTAVEKSVVISEIMWGIDKSNSSAPGAVQWIELYHMGVAGATADISLTGWKLKFLKDPTAAAAATGEKVIDHMSNQGFGWTFNSEQSGEMPGKSGRITPNNTLNQPVESIISAYRNIDRNFLLVGAANTTKEADRAGKVNDGTVAGNWKASQTQNGTEAPFLGTPGLPYGIVRVRTATSIARTVVINELGNGDGTTNDWVELRNTTGNAVNIKKWTLSILTDASTVSGGETELVRFADDNKFTLPANGVLVITSTHPRSANSPLASGRDINIGNAEDDVKKGSEHLYYVDSDINLPDTGIFTLILRNANDKANKPEAIQDVVGTKYIQHRQGNYYTDMWPLHGVQVSGDTQAGTALLVKNKVWYRENTSRIFQKETFKEAGFTGVGYDRKTPSEARYGGTPGYQNNVSKENVADIKGGNVYISEIMFMAGNRLPQWIELYNSSDVEAANLNEWTLEVQNADDPDLGSRQNYTLKLSAKTIPPKQTVLITSAAASRESNPDHFPASRVYEVWKDYRTVAEMTSRNDTILSTIGFKLILKDKSKAVVDEAGNLASKGSSDVVWALPGVANAEEHGARSSIMRDKDALNDGDQASSWRAAVDIVEIYDRDFKEVTYYGKSDDYGTPGFHGGGGPLPVQLSSFYSKRSDAGAVIITWATESELDNAGFNILRSTSRTGEFTKINAQLIPGAGTTGEKNTYSWTDASAKPNVLYYYQIEDVSLDGERRMLQTTRLRGHVGAAGKATTTWGDLKSRE